ncbi:von Willebrand factor-like [Ptychodera flava]|uniref:von Willebrand factor-like n=1 Tax=Ptychodera flava TaxID=63121 RepID=UPI003969C4A0
MAFATLLCCAFLFGVSASATIKTQEELDQVPFVLLSDWIDAKLAAKQGNPAKRQISGDDDDELPTEPTIIYQTYRTCNYILLLAIDFTATEEGSYVFEGGNMSYSFYNTSDPPASPNYTVVQQDPIGFPPYPTFVTEWSGEHPPCTNLTILVNLTNADGTLTRNASFIRSTACPCKDGDMKGDPHITTLDGFRYNINGPCDYTLLQDCIHTPPKWKIIVTNGQAIASSGRRRLECARLVMNTSDVELFQNGDVKVNGVSVSSVKSLFVMVNGLMNVVTETPDKKGKVVIPYDDTFFLAVEEHYQLKLGLKDDYYKGKTCGLLGNNNGDRKDDLYIKGQRNTNVTAFTEYWKVPNSCRVEKLKI